jgi:hypothetical protein
MQYKNILDEKSVKYITKPICVSIRVLGFRGLGAHEILSEIAYKVLM